MNVQGSSSNVLGRVAGTGTSNNTTGKTTMGNMDTTFLNLLITEMKSQDPTAPMDATQMVGQMVALNQLDQLIGIHQVLQDSLTAGTTTTSVATKGAI